jgi:chemotaxis protein histidine kinase CheA
MTVDPFADRVARVRSRFVSTLERKIDGSFAAVPKLYGDGSDATAAVGDAYRCLHGIVGIGPTVGFPETGRSAREAEDVLRAAQHDSRGLTADEVERFRKSLQALREAATRELQFLNPL